MGPGSASASNHRRCLGSLHDQLDCSATRRTPSPAPRIDRRRAGALDASHAAGHRGWRQSPPGTVAGRGHGDRQSGTPRQAPVIIVSMKISTESFMRKRGRDRTADDGLVAHRNEDGAHTSSTSSRGAGRAWPRAALLRLACGIRRPAPRLAAAAAWTSDFEPVWDSGEVGPNVKTRVPGRMERTRCAGVPGRSRSPLR